MNSAGNKSGRPASKPKSVLKKHMVGMEIEVFTLDNRGYVINAADSLIRKAKGKYPGIRVCHEAGENMIEIMSLPHSNIRSAIENLLEGFENLLNIAEKSEIELLTLGTYPGNFIPRMRSTKGYGIKSQLFGEKRFRIAGRCCGLHVHYTLPWGVFDRINLIPKMLINSKNQKSMVNSYNSLIAMDPALTTFTQSSPFYQGTYMGKDSRMIVYRGGKVFNNPNGLYSNHQQFGGLQPYKHTGTDLLHLITGKYEKWKENIKSLDVQLKVLSKHGSLLDTAWNPVKVNANGTLEQRGMDMNHPTIITGASMLIKSVLKKVQEDFIEVVPSDIGIKEPFKMEGNVIYIPPHTYVRMNLQPLAASSGMENDDILKYCKNLLKLAKSSMPSDRIPLLEPFESMVENRRTISDGILSEAKKMGYGQKGTLTNKAAAEIALEHSKRLFKEIVLLRKRIQEIGP